MNDTELRKLHNEHLEILSSIYKLETEIDEIRSEITKREQLYINELKSKLYDLNDYLKFLKDTDKIIRKQINDALEGSEANVNDFKIKPKKYDVSKPSSYDVWVNKKRVNEILEYAKQNKLDDMIKLEVNKKGIKKLLAKHQLEIIGDVIINPDTGEVIDGLRGELKKDIVEKLEA